MNTEEKIEPFYQARSDEFVNMLYDKRLLADDCNMETINNFLKNYVAWWLQFQVQSAIKVHDLVKYIREPKRPE